MEKVKTLKVRVKDKCAKELEKQAASVNFVWNYTHEPSHHSSKERRRSLSAYDFHPCTKGAGKALGLHNQKLQEESSSLRRGGYQVKAGDSFCYVER